MSDNQIRFSSVTPILRIFDESKAKQFYVDYLGFTVGWEHRFTPELPLYMEVQREGCVLHLSEHHGDACPGSAVRVATENIKLYHKELSAKNYAYAKPGLENPPWGTLEMDIKDPFGNRITFFEAKP